MKYFVMLLLPFLASNALATQCLIKNNIDDHKVNSSTSVTFDVGHDKYEFTTSVCGLDRPFTVMGFQTFSDFEVCEGDDILVIDQYNYQIIERCWIRKIEKIQP
jgi:hypothetical protein